MAGYGKTVELDGDFDQAVERVRQALGAQGFGVLTEIDVASTLRAKLGVEMERYLILGACNPQLAKRALDISRDVGLLLPCNVVVREDHGRVSVQALDPAVIVSVAADDALEPIAAEAAERLDAALEELVGR